jgi:hypothetical protein
MEDIKRTRINRTGNTSFRIVKLSVVICPTNAYRFGSLKDGFRVRNYLELSFGEGTYKPLTQYDDLCGDNYDLVHTV